MVRSASSFIVMGLLLTAPSHAAVVVGASSTTSSTSSSSSSTTKRCMTTSSGTPASDTDRLQDSPRDCLLPQQQSSNATTSNSTFVETNLMLASSLSLPTSKQSLDQQPNATPIRLTQNPAMLTWALTVVTLDMVSSLSNLDFCRLDNAPRKEKQVNRRTAPAGYSNLQKHRGRRASPATRPTTTRTANNNNKLQRQAFDELTFKLQRGQDVPAEQFRQLWLATLPTDQVDQAIALMGGDENERAISGRELLHLIPNESELETIYHQIIASCSSSSSMTNDDVSNLTRALFGIEQPNLSQDMMALADQNRNGQVSWDEFAHLFDSLMVDSSN